MFFRVNFLAKNNVFKKMLEEYLSQNEGKTLEFKESAKTLLGIIKTIIAFANTSGGILIIGVQDKTKEIIGIQNPLKEEERIANAVHDTICPLIMPDIEIHTYRGRSLIIVRVPHAAGPFYIKADGPVNGVYIRFGSTNRIADHEIQGSLKLFSENRTYDELPSPKGAIDEVAIKNAFSSVKKLPTKKTLESLGIFTEHIGKCIPTIGGTLLFASNRLDLFPDAIIRCARFKGVTKEKIIDQQEFNSSLFFALQEILSFIERNTRTEAVFTKLQRADIAEYPSFAIREALINAVLHADYAMKGCHIQIAIYDDRIEFINPGCLPFGQTIQKALSGFSKLRNRVIGRVFRELKLIEQWGSGLQRMLLVCKKEGLQTPVIEEYNNHFRIILFAKRLEKSTHLKWEEFIIKFLEKNDFVSTKEAARLWKVSDRTARTRLKSMAESGILQRVATSEKDPFATFVLRK